MTITTADIIAGPYAGTGSTTIFATPYFQVADDIRAVLIDDETGLGEVLVLGDDYTLSGALNPGGGSLTLPAALPDGQTLVITVLPDFKQQVAGTTPTIRALDKLALQILAVDLKTKRALRVSEEETLTGGGPVGLPPAAERLGKVGIFDDETGAFTAGEIGSGAIAAGSVTTAKLANDAVDLTKIYHGSLNTLLGFLASGPSEIGVGAGLTLQGGVLTAQGGVSSVAGLSGAVSAFALTAAQDALPDVNFLSDAERTKLTGIQAGATDDQTGAEIIALIDATLGSDGWQSGGAEEIDFSSTSRAAMQNPPDPPATISSNTTLALATHGGRHLRLDTATVAVELQLPDVSTLIAAGRRDGFLCSVRCLSAANAASVRVAAPGQMRTQNGYGGHASASDRVFIGLSRATSVGCLLEVHISNNAYVVTGYCRTADGDDLSLGAATINFADSATRAAAQAPPISPEQFTSNTPFSLSTMGGRSLQLHTADNSVTLTLPDIATLIAAGRQDGELCVVRCTSAANFGAIAVAMSGQMRSSNGYAASQHNLDANTVYLGLSRATSRAAVVRIYIRQSVYFIDGPCRDDDAKDLAFAAAGVTSIGGLSGVVSDAQVKTLLDAVADTNFLTDAERTKLTAIEDGATADQTGAEIVSAINAQLSGTGWQTGGSSSLGTFNVKDFGALGNDSANDSAALQAAIDATPNRGVVYFPPGIYRTDQLAVPHDRAITFAGASPKASIVRGRTVGHDIFRITDPAGATVQDRFGKVHRYIDLAMIVNTGTNGQDLTTGLNRCTIAGLAVGPAAIAYVSDFVPAATGDPGINAAWLHNFGEVRNCLFDATLKHDAHGCAAIYHGGNHYGWKYENIWSEAIHYGIADCFPFCRRVTADASANRLTVVNGANPFQNGHTLYVAAHALTGTMPGGLARFTEYFVVGRDGTSFQLSLTLGGAAIDLSSAGTGAIYVYAAGDFASEVANDALTIDKVTVYSARSCISICNTEGARIGRVDNYGAVAPLHLHGLQSLNRNVNIGTRISAVYAESPQTVAMPAGEDLIHINMEGGSIGYLQFRGADTGGVRPPVRFLGKAYQATIDAVSNDSQEQCDLFIDGMGIHLLGQVHDETTLTDTGLRNSYRLHNNESAGGWKFRSKDQHLPPDIADIAGLSAALGTVIASSSDTANSTTTPADIDDLTFTPAASTRYLIDAQLMVRSAATTTGPQIGIVWPTGGVTDGVADISIANSATAASLTHLTAADATSANDAFPATGASYIAKVTATLIMGASPAGPFKLVLRSEVDTSEVQVRAGSWLRYRVY